MADKILQNLAALQVLRLKCTPLGLWRHYNQDFRQYGRAVWMYSTKVHNECNRILHGTVCVCVCVWGGGGGGGHWPFVRGMHWSPVDSPHKGPVVQNFDAFFAAGLNKLLNKQLSWWWFEMPWCSCDVAVLSLIVSAKVHYGWNRISYVIN